MGKGRFIVEKELGGKRLDVALSEVSKVSRSSAQKLIASELVRINGIVISDKSRILREGDIVEYELIEPETIDAKPQPIDIEMVYEDEYLAVVNKPAGMVVHPAYGNPDGTLVNALLYHLKGLSCIGGKLRPGIVHRLDKDTSGLIVVAKRDDIHIMLSEQFAGRRIYKEYIAVVHGTFSFPDGEVVAPIGRSYTDRKRMAVVEDGRYARTLFSVVTSNELYSVLLVSPFTGRTHQIRVHLSYIKHPIVGDKIYGRKKEEIPVKRMCLHAYRLSFTHPVYEKKVEFVSCLPKDFVECLQGLGLSLPREFCTSYK